MFWSTSAFQLVMCIVSFSVFKETFSPLILQRRAAKLRAETSNERYQTVGERLHGHKSALSELGRALTRPVRLLLFHPIIQVTAAISAFNYGILYILLSTFSALWTDHYGVSVKLSGLHYIAIALGEIAGSQLGGNMMDLFYRRTGNRAPPPGSHPDDEQYAPEQRIPLTFPGALIGPLGLFLYGWAGQYRAHWAVVDVGIAVACFGGQIAGMPLTAYVIDAYPDHTSSAMAAQQFVRSLTAFLFPLFAPAMFGRLGYGWGSSTIAFAGLAIGLPAPLVIWYFGARLRAKAQSSY
jgi:hypothetical protein